ncbi:hypothetical protein, partial [Escherichia coli]|uniref:hypothetical protein n=2 Tax=Gammaproteobacteria TaxID=1236 RepID=UPI001C806048
VPGCSTAHALDLYIPLKTPQITLRDRELHRSSLRIVGKSRHSGVKSGHALAMIRFSLSFSVTYSHLTI